VQGDKGVVDGVPEAKIESPISETILLRKPGERPSSQVIGDDDSSDDAALARSAAETVYLKKGWRIRF
jgi:hypothetical protein